jgi:hypothetical protein
VEAVVDGLAPSSALPQDLPVFEPGDDVFDAGTGAAVFAVVVVVDDPAVGCSARTGDCVDAAVSAVAQDWPGAVEQMGDGVAGHDDVVAVAGPAAADCAIVAAHGNTITVEDCRISTWARLWGKRIALFSPGMLVDAFQHECHTTSGRLYRAGTHATAMSQHCLCGTPVAKTFKQRTHDCPHCGLRGDRDIISAALAACVELANPDDPRTARVDYRLAHALRDGLASQQEWEGSVNRHQPPPSPDEGSARTGSHHPAVTSAERAAPGTPPNRPRPRRGRRGTSRKQPAPKLIGAA